MIEQPVKGDLFLISAPSGAGKTSLLQALLKAVPRLTLSISHTTRTCRPGEQDGVDYHFVNEDKFKELIRKAIFLEHAQVFGHYYGTSKAWVEEQLRQGQDVLLEIDFQGAEQIRARYPTAVGIFIIPPSKQALQERLVKRQRDSAEDIQTRLSIADIEMQHADAFDYWVRNENFEQALSDLKAIIQAQRLRQKRQVKTGLLGWP